MPDEAVANIKRTFIDALRTTPAGILDFLETPIPEPPDIDMPADADAAAVANGIASKYFLDLFRPFAGVTPIELLLRIGQHNSILEAGLLAGLEYIGESDAQCDFDVISPVDGEVIEITTSPYLRIEAKNGEIINASYAIASAGNIIRNSLLAPVSKSVWINFEGFILEVGEYDITYSANYKTTQVQKTISITITDPNDPNAPPPTTPDDPTQPTPDNPDGDSRTALDIAKAAYDAAYRGAVQLGNAAADGFQAACEAAATAAQQVGTIATKIGGAAATAAQKMEDVIDAIIAQVGSREITIDEDLLMSLADLTNAVNTTYSAATQTYFDNNQHPSGGYTSSPRDLRGAAQAMNEKYGAGSFATY